jgi:hypothetical protein
VKVYSASQHSAAHGSIEIDPSSGASICSTWIN